MNLYVYDVEVAPNFFSAVVIPYKGDESKVFEISERRNDSQEIQQFHKQDLLCLVPTCWRMSYSSIYILSTDYINLSVKILYCLSIGRFDVMNVAF